MKTTLTWTLIFVPVLLFATYLVNALTGGIASLTGHAPDFYCGSYCFIGLAFFGLSLVVFAIAVYLSRKKFGHS